ncbi:hypothetical protein L798_07158 [Zootermopsis nevadensis]|uniref:BZIP domain-containing protein n=2 Tax=Zootermopsis nevadensis TaxID=136037 RepID=A0A067RHC7_ZOONE|nr:hypothetical protein L798_07158 [Zootermopsis nevadensis]
MLKRKDGLIWAVAQVSQRGNNSVGVLNSSCKEVKSTNHFHAVPNGMSYLEQEEPTWSQNIDSAASMFPPSTLSPTLDLGQWGENFQDLSSWCRKPPRGTSSITVDDTKGSSCIAQDDELNTPVIGVLHEFNFTSTSCALQEETSPYLCDGASWEIPPPLDLLQMPCTDEDKKSFETVKKTDSDNTQSTPADAFFVDDTLGLSVGHEEEIVSSHINQERIDLEVTENKEPDDLKLMVNANELGDQSGVKRIDFGNCESVEVSNRAVKGIGVGSGSLESLLGLDFGVEAVNGIFSVDRNSQRADTNLNLKNILAGSICHITSDEQRTVETPTVTLVANEVSNAITTKSQVIGPSNTNIHLIKQSMRSKESFSGKDAAKFASPSVNGSKEFCGSNAMAANIWRTDVPVKMGEQPKAVNCKHLENAVPVEVLADDLPSSTSSEPHLLLSSAKDEITSGHVMKPQFAVNVENATKRNLRLNLATQLSADDIISTPVVLEPLLKQGEPFDLLAYVFDDDQAFRLDWPDTIGVGFDGKIPKSCTAEASGTKPTNNAELLGSFQGDATVSVVEPFVTEKSPDGRWNIIESEHMEVEEIEDESLSSSIKILGKSDVQFEGWTKTNVTKGFKAVRETRKHLSTQSTLESKILQDGPVLKLKISKRKLSAGRGSDTNVLSQKQVSPRKNVSELEELPLSRRTRGKPEKRSSPSTSKEEESRSGRGSLQRRRSSSRSVPDDAWTPPSKRSRQSSVDSDCDRYRELRDRNNEASRKSRQSRKVREGEMKETAGKLERENQSLKIKADEMERLVKKLREALLEAVMKTKKE